MRLLRSRKARLNVFTGSLTLSCGLSQNSKEKNHSFSMKGCLSAEGGRKAGGSGGFGIAILLRYFSMDGIKFETNLAYGSIESRNTTLHSREHLLGWTYILPQHLQRRSILSIGDVLKRYIRSIIGDGSNTNVWSDIWLSEGSLIDLFGERVIYDSGSSETRDQ